MKTQLKKNEKIELTVRKHWFVLLKPILWTVILLTVVITMNVLVGESTNDNRNLFFYGTILTIILTIIWFIYKVFDRNNNLWAVTNLRIIDEYGVFTSNSKETPLDKINNVSYRQPFLGRLFNYGNVQIQSAAESGSTIHEMVSRPKILKDTITQYQELYKQEQIELQAQSLANAVSDQSHSSKKSISQELTKLHDLKEKGVITEEDFQKLKNKILND